MQAWSSADLNSFLSILAASAPPRSVIETHGMSSQGQRLPSAMELSLHKIQRERQMAQALIEQRQLSQNFASNVRTFLFICLCLSIFHVHLCNQRIIFRQMV